jgi:hypothetical protein
MRQSILLVLILAAGCGRPTVRVQLPAPNPNGCYVMVFEQPEFRGIGDVWNGPARWSSLDGLRQTRADGWRNRIRSLRIGSAAAVTVFTDVDFRGLSRRFAADSDHAQLENTFSGRIESLELSCQ